MPNTVPTAVYYRLPRNNNNNKTTNLDSHWRNQPQSNAMISASMLFIAGGMDMALGLGWNQNTFVTTTHHLQFSWFIGVIAGALIAAPLIPYLPKKIFLTFGGLLVLASGIVYVSVPYQYDAIIAARYVSGVGIGLTMVSFLVHGSEVGATSYRGSVLSLEQYALTVGIAIQVIYASQWTPFMNFAANRVHGIFLIFFAVVGIASIYLAIESPIFYIRKGDDVSALECIRLLHRPQIVTNETQAQLENLKLYVVQEDNQSMAENFRKGLQPLLKTLIYRSMVAFSFSLPLSGAIEVSSYYGMDYPYSWPPIVFAILRVLGAFIAIWLVDGLGRKGISLFALLCMAGLILGVGIIYSNGDNIYNSDQMSIACTLLLISQFFAGLFVPSSTVYLGEAFPLALKPYMVAFCIIIEQIIQLVTIVTFVFTMYNEFVYCITVAIIMFGFFIYFCMVMPETRKTTLKEAQNRFRYLLYLKLW